MNPDSAALLRAIKGPVMMITVGVLFALENFTPFGFSRTWPVLLVVAGILNLAKGPRPSRRSVRYQVQWGVSPTPAPPPPPPAGPSWAQTAAPSGNPTAAPGTYRGSSYESTPGSSAPRENASRENKEKRERPAMSEQPPAPPGSGGPQ
jgi:hypothetical protein